MIWTIKLAFVILLTTVTGSVLTVVWYGIGRGLGYTGCLNLLYWIFRAIQIFWFFPLSWLALTVTARRNGTAWFGMMFFPSPLMLGFCKVICLLWSAGAAICMASYARLSFCHWRLVKEACPCDRETMEVLRAVREELHIPAGRVSLRQTYRVEVPLVTGVRHLTILLPMAHYTEDELYFVFLHEMMHVRHRDLLAKNMACMAEAFHFFNPIVWWYRKLLDQWGEYVCDYSACIHCGRVRAYYESVISMIPREETAGCMMALFVRGSNEVKQRIRYVKRCLQTKKKSGAGGALVVSLMVALGSTTVYAATSVTADAVYQTQEAASVETREIAPEDDLVEHTETEPVDSDLFEEGEVKDLKERSAVKEFSWTLYAGYGTYGTRFRVTKDTSIVVAAKAIPSGKTYKLGIIQPDGSRVFVEGSGALSHTFTAGETGYYYVYAQNISGSTLSLSGSYIY